MTGVLNLTKIGRIRAAEFDHSWQVPSSEYRGVVLCHGSGAPFQYTVAQSHSGHRPMIELPWVLGEAGFHSVAGQMSGESFANDASQTDVSSARTLLGTLGATTDKVHLFGASMGAGVALRWAINNPTLTASVTGIIPMVNPVYMYENNIGGLQAAIGAAWGVTHPTPLPAGADLMAQASSLAGSGVSVRLYYSDPDAFVVPSHVTDFATDCGGEAFQVGTQGHTVATERDAAAHLAVGDEGGPWTQYASDLILET